MDAERLPAGAYVDAERKADASCPACGGDAGHDWWSVGDDSYACALAAPAVTETLDIGPICRGNTPDGPCDNEECQGHPAPAVTETADLRAAAQALCDHLDYGIGWVEHGPIGMSFADAERLEELGDALRAALAGSTDTEGALTAMGVFDVPTVIVGAADPIDAFLASPQAAEELARAVATSLATDGYIDLFRSDGEEFLRGDSERADDITGTATSILAAWQKVREQEVA